MEPKPSAFYTITFSSTLIKNKMFFVCSIYIYVVFTYSNVTVYQYVSEKYTIQYNSILFYMATRAKGNRDNLSGDSGVEQWSGE